ncbi:MAG: hypothetical protein KL785_02265 [Brevundimonas sp.]|nr:hypothetical protein [Brevundimonas sp.]
MSVTMAVALVGCVWWWRGIDEAAREAHKWAWWWGGSGGVLVGAIFLLTLTFSDEAATPVEVGVSAPGPDRRRHVRHPALPAGRLLHRLGRLVAQAPLGAAG